MITADALERFRARLEAEQGARYAEQWPGAYAQDRIARDCAAHVHYGPKYTRVDVGTSGKYMVENSTGAIYGIKGYGRVHRGHAYGTLDTVDDWDWSGYRAVPRRGTP